MSWAFKRDMAFLFFAALSCLGGLWTLPVIVMGAIGVAHWQPKGAAD